MNWPKADTIHWSVVYIKLNNTLHSSRTACTIVQHCKHSPGNQPYPADCRSVGRYIHICAAHYATRPEPPIHMTSPAEFRELDAMTSTTARPPRSGRSCWATVSTSKVYNDGRTRGEKAARMRTPVSRRSNTTGDETMPSNKMHHYLYVYYKCNALLACRVSLVNYRPGGTVFFSPMAWCTSVELFYWEYRSIALGLT